MRPFLLPAVLLLSLSSEALAQPSADPSADPEIPPPATEAPPLRGGAALQALGQRNLLRGSYFNWTTFAPTKLLGVGKDYIGTEAAPAVMAFALAPRFTLLDTGAHWLRIGTTLAWSVELGSSDSTTKSRQVLLADLPIEVAYDHAFLQNKGGPTLLAGPALGVSFPTSLASRSQGKYATTNLGIGTKVNIPLRSGEGLNALFLTGGLGWSHLFSRAGAPTANGDVAQRPRTTCDVAGNCGTEGSDPLSGTLFTRDTVSLHFTYWLNLWGDLSLGNGWGYEIPFKDNPPTAGCIKISTGCAPPAQAPSSSTGISTTTFGLSLGYAFARLVWAEIGYSNVAGSLGEDGTRRSVFYSPDAQFYLSGTVLLDGAYGRIEQAIRPKAAEPDPVKAP